MSDQDIVTKAELSNALTDLRIAMRNDIHEIVSEIVGDALQVIDARFNRLEAKLDATVEWVGQHEVAIKQLQKAVA